MANLTIEAMSESTIEHTLATHLKSIMGLDYVPVMNHPTRALFMWRGVTLLGADASRHIGVTLTDLHDDVDDLEQFVAENVEGIAATAAEIAKGYDEPLAEGLAVTVAGLANNLKGFEVEDALVEQHGFEPSTYDEDVRRKIDLWLGEESVQVKPAADKRRITAYPGDFDVLAVYNDNGDDTYTVALERSTEEPPAYRRAGFEG